MDYVTFLAKASASDTSLLITLLDGRMGMCNHWTKEEVLVDAYGPATLPGKSDQIRIPFANVEEVESGSGVLREFRPSRQLLTAQMPFMIDLLKALGLETQAVVELHIHIKADALVYVDVVTEALVPNSDDASRFLETTKRYTLVPADEISGDLRSDTSLQCHT